MSSDFQYEVAFGRNIGWITRDEADQLRCKRVAIAGLGGVGGAYLLALVRLGIGRFHISDFDRFELPNFNRQVGATMSRLGRSKVDVLAEMALDVNPQIDIRKFERGVDASNLDEFFRDVDLYIDGLDFFAMDARRAVFAACAEKGLAAITAAPLGWGVSMLTFLPGEMTFEQYFQMEEQSEIENLCRFLVGLSPEGLQLGALVDPTRLDIGSHRGPSTVVGCELCAGLAVATAVKILLGRGPVVHVPKSVHFDAFTGTCSVLDRPGGISHAQMQERLNTLRAQLGMTD
jgi:molybdopterin/thiamine biosynthesis adenylyltransferase